MHFKELPPGPQGELFLDRSSRYHYTLIFSGLASWLTLLLWTLPWFPASSVPAAFFILLTIFRRQWLWRRIVDYRTEIILLVLVLLLGIIFSRVPTKSLKGIYDFLRGAVFFFPALFLAGHERERLRRGFWPAVCVGLVVLLLAAVWAWNEGNGSLKGFQKQLILSFRHYNIFATCVATVGVFAVCGALFDRSRNIYPWLGWGLLFLSGALTFFTGSRGTFLALVAIVALGCYLRFRTMRKWLCLVGGILVVGLTVLVTSGWLGQHVSVWHRGSDFTAGRLNLFNAILEVVSTQGPFTGFGINTYKYLGIAQPLPFQVTMPHNVLLESLFSLGLIGTILLVVLAVLLARRLQGCPIDPVIYHAGLLLIVFYLLRGTLDMKLFSQYFPAALAFGYGMMAGALGTGAETSG